MSESAPSAAQGRRFPRLSIPGGLLLVLCLFLPLVKACDEPVYPIKLPAIYGPYLFGLLAVVLAFLPLGRAAVGVRFAAWAIGTISAAGEGWFFLDSLLAHHQISPQRWLWLGPLLWLPLTLLLVTSRGILLVGEVGAWQDCGQNAHRLASGRRATVPAGAPVRSCFSAAQLPHGKELTQDAAILYVARTFGNIAPSSAA